MYIVLSSISKEGKREIGYTILRLCYKTTLKFMKNKQSQEHTPYFHLRKSAAFLFALGVNFQDLILTIPVSL